MNIEKSMKKDWSCYNICKSNCCSDLFLPLSSEHIKSFQENGYWIVDNNYTDWRWAEYHKSIKIEKLKGGLRKITFLKNVPFDIIYNPFIKKDMIYILDKCCNLLPNNKCKIFRSRPKSCRIAECPIFSRRPEIQFYKEHGVLKDLR